MQLLVEVPPGEQGPLDLSGDAGAVGRFSAAPRTEGDDDEGGAGLLLDLKGVVYNAALVAMPCTACVVNIGQKDGKVCPQRNVANNQILWLTAQSASAQTRVS